MEPGLLAEQIGRTGKKPHRAAAIKQLEAIATVLSTKLNTSLVGHQLVYCYEDVNPSSNVNPNALSRVYFRDLPTPDKNTKYYRTTIIEPVPNEEDEVRVSLLTPMALPPEAIQYLLTECKKVEKDIIHPYRSIQVANVDDLGLAKKEAIPQTLLHHIFYSETPISPQALCVLFNMDGDDFKGVNDTYGHEGGNRVIRATYGAVKATTQQFGDRGACGHPSGDEYEALLADTSDSEVKKYRNDLHEATSDPSEFPLYYTPQRRTERVALRKSSMIPTVELELPKQIKLTIGHHKFSTEGWTPASFSSRFHDVRIAADDHMYELKKQRKAGSSSRS